MIIKLVFPLHSITEQLIHNNYYNSGLYQPDEAKLGNQTWCAASLNGYVINWGRVSMCVLHTFADRWQEWNFKVAFHCPMSNEEAERRLEIVCARQMCRCSSDVSVLEVIK